MEIYLFLAICAKKHAVICEKCKFTNQTFNIAGNNVILNVKR